MKAVYNKFLYYFIIFMLGSVVGYIYEVIFYKLTLGIWNNWGILYGPWLPIYGTGAVLLSFLYQFKKKPVLLFVLSIIITGIVELVIGYISVNIFNQRLWDYTGLLLNIKGLVCLRSVLSFSCGSMFLIYIIIPFINNSYNNYKWINYVSILILIIFIIDIIISNLFRTPYTF